MVRYSFLVRLSHPLLNAGLSRRFPGSPYLPVPKRWAESQPDLLRRLQIDDKLELRQSFYNVGCLLVNPPRHRGGVDGAGYFPKCHLFRETAIVRSSAIEEAIPRPPLDATCQTDARSGL